MATSFASISDEVFQPDTPLAPPSAGPSSELALSLLERVFATRFGVLDVQGDRWLSRQEGLPRQQVDGLVELCQGISCAERPEIIAFEDPFAVLALPLSACREEDNVAVGTFIIRTPGAEERVCRSARALGMEPEDAAAWARRQTPWAADALCAAGSLVVDHLAALRKIDQVEQEADNVTASLASTYEEISLLYRLTQNLKISESDEELGRVALQWMDGVIPAEGMAIRFLANSEQRESLTRPGRSRDELLSSGRCPVDEDTFTRLVDHLKRPETSQPIVVNRRMSAQSDWPFPEVRQCIAVPLVEGENLFGWLAVFNHIDGAEFGTVEASLLSSVGAILGIHSGNIELYRQQAELLEGVVRALTSAIDAKDGYTRGHSDRVARVSVRLAKELGCDPETLKTIYLSGLLHDIGKIGIDDNVLRKPDQLTDKEYEHIKTHVEVGHRILMDLKKLDNVLPVVLHHHESWDGGGYPANLPAEEIPLAARIVAVADALDAMGSDRPYRKGMADEKIDLIFRTGAGRQWDPTVVEALFRCRDEVRQIMQEGRAADAEA